MSFYLAETPTLEAVATEDERALAQDLQARVAEAVRQAESQAPVAEAAEEQKDAQDRLERLRTAERALNRHAKESRERIAQERAEKVLEQLRGAVREEMVLPVDMSKGVAGALLARAAGLKRLAVQVSDNADRIERAYHLMNGDRR